MADEFALLQEIFAKLEPTPLAHEHPLTSPLSDCFSWAELFTKSPVPRQLKLYGVAFRSVRKYDVVDDTLLYAADAKAFEEAMESRQLLRYWYGNLNERKECLATCIWRSREEARNAATAPLHAKAASLAPHFYHKYTLDRYWLNCSPDGSFSIEIIQ